MNAIPTTMKRASLASVSKAGPSPETSQRKRPPVDWVTLLSHNRFDVDCDIYVNNNNHSDHQTEVSWRFLLIIVGQFPLYVSEYMCVCVCVCCPLVTFDGLAR